MRFFISLIVIFFLFLAVPAKAQSNDLLPDKYYKAEVLKILSEDTEEGPEGRFSVQQAELKILNGDKKDQVIIVSHGNAFAIREDQKISPGDKVIVTKPGNAEDGQHYINDFDRRNSLLFVVIFFLALAIFFGHKKGLTSMLGLAFTILVIFYGIIPAIIKGSSPLIATIIGSLIIAVVSLYLSHGFNRRTSIALLSTVITLVVALILDVLFVKLTRLSGASSEESVFLQYDLTSIDLRGLLIAGILLGVLGVLDDVTTAQTAAVEELKKANSSLSLPDLYHRGLSIGREHIASLVNTLVLAYVGVSFPMILLLALNKNIPLWLTINSNFMAEEIVRTLVGSSALILAVPLTTLLAAFFYSYRKS